MIVSILSIIFSLVMFCSFLVMIVIGRMQNMTIAEQQERIRGYQQTLAEMQQESRHEWGMPTIVEADTLPPLRRKG